MAPQSPRIKNKAELGKGSFRVELEDGSSWIFTKKKSKIWATRLGEQRKTISFDLEAPVFLKFLESAEQNQAGGVISAPSQGKVLRLFVTEGAEVQKGDVMIVLEAMKTEVSLRAPLDGKIQGCSLKIGDVVKRGQKLFTLNEYDPKHSEGS